MRSKPVRVNFVHCPGGKEIYLPPGLTFDLKIVSDIQSSICHAPEAILGALGGIVDTRWADRKETIITEVSASWDKVLMHLPGANASQVYNLGVDAERIPGIQTVQSDCCLEVTFRKS